MIADIQNDTNNSFILGMAAGAALFSAATMLYSLCSNKTGKKPTQSLGDAASI